MTNLDDRAASVPRFEMRHRLNLALEHADVSIGEMADFLDVGRNTVGNYLAGRTKPSKATLRSWALRCGLPLSWIESGIEPTDRDDGNPGEPGITSGRTRRYAGRELQLAEAA